jgi:UDP-N-acetylglucosamine acyltransferase
MLPARECTRGDDSMAIHPTAVVDPAAQLGNVEVGPYVVIGPGVTLHDAVIYGETVMGEGCRVHAFATIGGDPQDLKYRGEPTRLEIGRNNTFREYVTINRGTSQGGGVTRIGDGNLFMACVHIAHDCQIGNEAVFGNSTALAGHVTVGDNAFLSGLAAVHQFCQVGRRAMVAGGSMAALDVPPFSIAQGDRARLFGLNIVGLRRGGYSNEQIAVLRQAWRELFGRSSPMRIAMAKVREQWGQMPEVLEMVEFIERSQRGVCRAATSPEIGVE